MHEQPTQTFASFHDLVFACLMLNELFNASINATHRLQVEHSGYSLDIAVRYPLNPQVIWMDSVSRAISLRRTEEIRPLDELNMMIAVRNKARYNIA